MTSRPEPDLDRSIQAISEIRDTPGDWLFHYTTLETALVHILPACRLRLSPFSRMRDPRESKQWFTSVSGYTDGVTSTEKTVRAWAAAEARVNVLRDEFKLLSFTMDEDDPTWEAGPYGRGFARSRLWEQYARGGSGVCLVLRKDEALRAIPPQLAAAGTGTDGPVLYENARLATEIAMSYDEILSADLDAIADRIANSYLDRLFLVKNTEWQSEREYRFIVRSASEYEYVDVSTALVAVCRGPECPADAEHALRHFAAERDLAIGIVRWDNNWPMLIGRSLTSPATDPDTRIEHLEVR
jgi:Protein of unknown function (DUF2971)